MLYQTFKHLKNVLLFNKRHLAVYLGELRLTVGAQILIAETFHDLEITVESTDHKELFESLRRLRQSIELTGIHARRHNEVTRTLRSRFDKHRSLNLEEAFGIEITTDLKRHTVAQLQIATHA